MAKKRFRAPRSVDTRLGVPSLELVLGSLERLPGSYAAACCIHAANGEWNLLTALKPSPRDYVDPDDFAVDLLASSLLRKYPGLPGSSDKSSTAIAKWLACESDCAETNLRLREFRTGQIRTDLAHVFHVARNKVQKLLGPFSWSKVARHFDFGPGSTTRLPFSQRHLPFKYGEAPETTFDNLATSSAILSLSPAWCISSGGYYTSIPLPCFRITEASKITTVPKDAFIDRVIAIEPDMNMFVQKGFGGYIRRRLRFVGVDLDDQSLNQSLARSASLGGLATLDLSSASDTVSYELVREILPPDWFEALLSCRAHKSRLPSGEVIDLQKFSSMGNGFTFELESLIFWALCSSVASSTIGREGLRVSVYGDDIICHVSDYGPIVDVLTFAGFKVNSNKSFCDGPYRESCGKHYFYGRDVTPITITKEVSDVPKLLLLCNNLVRWAIRNSPAGLGRNASVLDAYRYLVRHLPDCLRRPRIPDGVGDMALIGSFDEAVPSRCRLGWDGWRVSGVLLPIGRNRRFGGVATLSASLATLEKANSRNSGDQHLFVEKRERTAVLSSPGIRHSRGFGSVGGRPDVGGLLDGPSLSTSVSSVRLVTEQWKLGKIFVRQWCDIGPWV